MKKKVLVCGGRDFKDWTLFCTKLDDILFKKEWIISSEDGNWLPNVVIISGMARGADQMAVDYAAVNWLELKQFPANWALYGKRAGYVRNKQMLEEGDPDLVVAFPGGRGTEMMIKIAKEANVEVIEVTE